MKTLEILGTGCRRCEALAANAETAARELNLPYELFKVSDIEEILEYGVFMTPALVIDGEVKIVGKIASVEEIKQLLT